MAFANGCSLIFIALHFYFRNGCFRQLASIVLRANRCRLHSLNIAKSCHKLAIAFNHLLLGRCPKDIFAILLFQPALLQMKSSHEYSYVAKRKISGFLL